MSSYPPPPPPGPPPSYPPYGPPPGFPPPPPPPHRSRALPIVLAVVTAVLVLAAAIVLPLVLLTDDDDSSNASDDTSEGADDEAAEANLDEVEEYDDLDPTHVTDDVDYPQSPPVGGPHHGEWLDCGVYDAPVPDEYAVHDLEHGTVWITYRADAVDEGGLAQLAQQLPQNGILSPYPDQDAPVVITAWGRQLHLVGPDDPRIPLFIEQYGAGETAPEPFASCAGGTADPGGRVVLSGRRSVGRPPVL